VATEPTKSPAPGPLEGGRVAITPTAWRPRRTLALDEWSDQGRRLGLMGRGTGWWIGDWLAYGNAAYGEKYSRAAKLTGYDVQTLMNMVWVASHFEPSRRRERLSWSHHAEVASMAQAEQDRWLDRALVDRLSVRSLREEITLTHSAEVRRARAQEETSYEVTCPECGYHFSAQTASSSHHETTHSPQ
jgi:hypothetical protein